MYNNETYNPNSTEFNLSKLEDFQLYHKFNKQAITNINNRSVDYIDKVIELGKLLKTFANNISKYYNVSFPTLYNILVFIGNKFDIDTKLQTSIIQLSKNLTILKNNKNIVVNEANYKGYHNLLTLYFEFIFFKIYKIEFKFESKSNKSNFDLENSELKNSELENSEKLNEIIKKSNLSNQTEQTNTTHQYFDLLNLTYISRKKIVVDSTGVNKSTNKPTQNQTKSNIENSQYFLKFISNGQEYLIKYNSYWEKLNNYIYNGLTINALQVKYNKEQNLYYTTEQSLIVLEPDLLFDATEIAENFLSSNFVIENHFLAKYKDFRTNKYLVLGNLVNFMLDEMVTNNEVDFGVLVQKAFKNKILSYVALYLNHQDELFGIEADAKQHFLNLQKVKKNINFKNVLIEPSFISPIYGLQGRLDLLEFDENDNNKKNIIELKSSKPPETMTINLGNYRVPSIISFTHLIQVTCYNLLLDSTFKNRTGNSYILYSKDNVRYLRDAINHINIKREVILARNSIVFRERELLLNDKNILNSLNDINYEKFSYSKEDYAIIINKLNALNEVKKTYFIEFTKFIIRESYSQRIGFENSNNNSYSKLWRTDKKNRQEINLENTTNTNSDLLFNLTINNDKSDFETLHIYLESNESEITSSLRNGDLITLIPNENNDLKIYNYIIIKGYIKEISKQHLIISFRNKQIDERYLNNYHLWNIYPDFSDTTNKRLHKSIFNFVTSKQFEVFSGQLFLSSENDKFENEKHEVASPTLDKKMKLIQSQTAKYTSLTNLQLELINNAIYSEDLYLVQGPPGSGKTSFFIHHLIKYYFENSELNILITSYTNRAIEELCKVLHKLGLDEEYLRIGTKANDSFGQFLVEYSNANKIEDTIIKVKNCRIFISTISSLITNPELFEIKKFDVAIVDEASQILESQITVVLSNVKKVVLIGDEKQLPAITTQIPKQPSEMLVKNFGFTSLSNSYFERMINLLERNQITTKYGMLKEQARMNSQIMQFANEIFYDNKLQLSKFKIEKYKHLKTDNYIQYENSNFIDKKILKTILDKKVAFFDVAFNHGNNSSNNTNVFIKSNPNEADITMSTINSFIQLLSINSEQIGSDFINKNTFGVISPFRLHNTLIKNSLLKNTLNTLSNENDVNLSDLITVDTVERYQGSEREIIIFNSIIQNQEQIEAIQSLKTFGNRTIDRKFNVALTRAKEIFILVGNRKILEQMDSYKDFIELCDKEQSIINFNL